MTAIPPTTDVPELAASRQAAAAALAGGMIAASRRPWSLREAVDIFHHVHFAMYPSSGHGN
jgi:hypothetical protein